MPKQIKLVGARLARDGDLEDAIAGKPCSYGKRCADWDYYQIRKDACQQKTFLYL